MFLNTISKLRNSIISSIDLSNKRNSFQIAVLAAILVLAAYPILADDDGGESLINYQANTSGDTFVTFRPGNHGVIPREEIKYVPENTLELPADFLDALEANPELEFEIVMVYQIKDADGIEVRAARCHRHASGTKHCHMAR